MKWSLGKYFSGIFPVERRTTDNNYLEVNKLHGRFVLDSEHVNYSFGALHKVFQKAFERIKPDILSFKRTLVLGFGAGSVAYILQKELKLKGDITGVEIDPDVIELARKYFGLEDLQNLKIEIEDAYDYVSREKKKYDLIVVDLFIDHLIPEKFDQENFLIQLERLLKKGGTLLYNRMNESFQDQDRIKSFRKTCAVVFRKAELSEEFNIGSHNIIFHIKK